MVEGGIVLPIQVILNIKFFQPTLSWPVHTRNQRLLPPTTQHRLGSIQFSCVIYDVGGQITQGLARNHISSFTLLMIHLAAQVEAFTHFGILL